MGELGCEWSDARKKMKRKIEMGSRPLPKKKKNGNQKSKEKANMRGERIGKR